jgi:hypothetical protein
LVEVPEVLAVLREAQAAQEVWLIFLADLVVVLVAKQVVLADSEPSLEDLEAAMLLRVLARRARLLRRLL